MLTSLMVYVDTHESECERIELAGLLADRFDSMLIGMSAMDLRPPVVVDDVVVDGAEMQSEIKTIKAILAEKGNWFRSIADGRRKLEWRTAVDLPTNALARECRCADLVVIGREAGRGDVYSALDPAGAILKVGRPVLVVPPKVKSLSADHVVVGWKDTREARRAVSDALPLLRKAARVLVVEICEFEREGRGSRGGERRGALPGSASSPCRTPVWFPWKKAKAQTSSSGRPRRKAPTCWSQAPMGIAVSANGSSAA